MSRTKKIVLITSAIALVCLIGAGITIGVFFSRGSDFASFSNIFEGSMTEVDESASLDMDGISTLAINCDSADIEFVDSSDAKVTLSGKILGAKNMKDVLSVYEQGGVLHIDSKIEPQFFNISTGFDMTVYIPADAMVDLIIDCTSGDMVIDGMQFGDMTIGKTSGDTSISGCTAGAFIYTSTSGDMDIAQCDFDSLRIKSTSGSLLMDGMQIDGDMAIAKTSGDVSISQSMAASVDCESASGTTVVTQCDFDSLRIKSTSGHIDISDMPGAITIDAASGGVDITGAQDALDITSISGGVSIDCNGADIPPMMVNVTSGGVKLYVDADAAFDLKAKVTSGHIETDMDIAVTGALGDNDDIVDGTAGGGGNLVSITSTSGGIEIYQK